MVPFSLSQAFFTAALPRIVPGNRSAKKARLISPARLLLELPRNSASGYSISAGPRQAAYRHAPAALAEIIAVVAVGQITEGNSGRRISPSDLPAESRMAKRFRRIRASETTQVRLAVAARDHYSQRPIRRYAARRIDQISTPDASRITQHLRLPATCTVVRFAVIEQRLVEERDVARSGHQTPGWKVHPAELRVVHFEHDILVDGLE